MPDKLVASLSNLKVTSTKYKTAFVCDEEMKKHFCKWNPNHPETPMRLISSLNQCHYFKLINRCLNIVPRRAYEKELIYIHDKKYIETVEKTKDMKDSRALEKFSSNFDSIYFNNNSFDCALLAAGCTLDLVSSVANGIVENGLAIVRPPGHHAMPNEACGFCIFNNVALAAKFALENHNIKRILIVDWDVHHGNGTQQIFYEDDRVLYFSIHRYEFGRFWPNLLESNFNFIGRGIGKGYNINIPLNKIGLGNSEYLSIFHNILLPVASEFNPQLILISAGYDAAVGCIEGEMNNTPYLYAHLVNELSVLANGRVCVILEGGYFIPSLAESIAVTLRALLGDPCPIIGKTDVINRSVINTVLSAITVLRPFWKSLCLQNVQFKNNGSEGLHTMSVRSVGHITFPGAPYPTREDSGRMKSSRYEKYETLVKNLRSNTDLTVPMYKIYLAMVEMSQYRIPKLSRNTTHSLSIYEELTNKNLLNKCLLDASNITKLSGTDYLFYKSELQKICSALNISLSTNDDISSFISVLEAVDNILRRDCVNSLVTIKYPGQSTKKLSILHFLMIAAKYAHMENHLRKNIKKVLILNWDKHLKIDLQPIHYINKNVIIISLCHYDDLPSNINVCLNAHGTINASNINIPWKNSAKSGDYFAAIFNVILPIAYEFCPDLILVAGFDIAHNSAHYFTELPSCYRYILKLLSGLANGKMILVMENGSEFEFISEFTFHYIMALLGEPSPPLPDELYPSYETVKLIQSVVKLHEKYWKCLQFGREIPILDESCLR